MLDVLFGIIWFLRFLILQGMDGMNHKPLYYRRQAVVGHFPIVV